MKKHLLTIPAALLLLSACSSKDEFALDPHHKISFDFGGFDTKALVSSSSDLCQGGNALHVYDLISDYPEWPVGKVGLYINDIIRYDATNLAWAADAGTYYWTQGGKHKFFAWSYRLDGVGVTDLIKRYNISTYAEWASIEPLTFTEDSPQFDFIYSDLVYRDMNLTVRDYSRVPFNFSHLFTAFDLVVRNNSFSNITLHSVTMTGLKNCNSALLKYETARTIQYGTPTEDGAFITSNPMNVVIPAIANHVASYYDVFDKSLGGEQCRLVWPQNGVDLTFEVSYTIDGQDQTRSVTLNNVTMNPGEKSRIILEVNNFIDIPITASISVIPWDQQKVTTTLNIEGTSLYFDPTRYEVSGSEVRINNDAPVSGKFSVSQPSDGIWMATLTGDTDYFTVSPSSGLINGNEVTLTITPNTDPALDRTADRKVHLLFSVISPNMDLDATSVLNTRDYIIKLPRKIQ